jgi:hypothetical protein
MVYRGIDRKLNLFACPGSPLWAIASLGDMATIARCDGEAWLDMRQGRMLSSRDSINATRTVLGVLTGLALCSHMESGACLLMRHFGPQVTNRWLYPTHT